MRHLALRNGRNELIRRQPSLYSLCRRAAVGAVYEAEVVFLSQFPVLCVPLDKARDDYETQNHQVDAREDLIHQRRLVHAEGQKS